MQLRGAGDRYIQGICARSHLRRRCPLLTGDALQQIDQHLLLLQRLRREARQVLAEITFRDLRFRAPGEW